MNKGSLMLQAESNRDLSTYSPLARLTSAGNIIYPFVKAAPKVLNAKMHADRDNIKSSDDADRYNRRYHKHVEFKDNDVKHRHHHNNKKGHN